ncbi:MAG: peptidase [Thaumarchaeota archaeon]|nr:peptidase [Nitrososphaerota archaeon]
MIIGASAPNAFAQFQSGGVNKPGDWYVGEGLKVGDQFSYRLCYVDYKECAEFQIDFWISGEKKTGTEEKWLAQTVIYDGNKIVKGEMELGKVAPEPTGGSTELSVYRGAFKSSLAWLSAYATNSPGDAVKGPKKFSAPSWGKIGNIGGEQIIPTALETITVPEGKFETVVIQWKTGGYFNNVWIVDEFPFPIKASTWAHVAEGIPPQEYRFELLDYKQNVKTDPFSGIVPTPLDQSTAGCPKNYSLVEKRGNTKQFTMIVEVKYGPPNPVPSCQIEWFINFKNKYDETKFLNQVHYDILVVDDSLKPIRSIAQDDGRQKLFSASGQVQTFTIVKEKPGTAHYVIWIYGTNPEQIIPPAEELDYFQVDIPISSKSSQTPIGTTLNIPTWIKNNAKWWSAGTIGDSDFISGIQYLINQGIMKIPQTTLGSSTGSNVIPTWVKNNAKWWSEGTIGDQDFVSGIQYLITNGILKIKQ